ncbi:MAG: type II secretion system F family protein [Gemmatimonadetes bacterium]|nr:type II secretion system F family protein [Gemmatimonadota bacterium]
MPSFLSAYRALDDGRHREEFYRMWRAAVHAGLTNEFALRTIGPRGAPHVEEMRDWLLDGARRGQRVTYLVRTGGKRFEPMERALLVLGEETGTFEEALQLLARFYQSKHRLILWIKKQMAYPMFTAICMVFIAPFPLLYFGQTAAYIGFVTTGCIAWVTAGGSFLIAAAERYGKRPPLVRARFARALATGVEAGLPLPRAIRLAAEAANDPNLTAFVNGMDEHQLAAGGLHETFSGAPHMTADLIGALAVADRTGDFTTTLRKIADLYEDGFR